MKRAYRRVLELLFRFDRPSEDAYNKACWALAICRNDIVWVCSPHKREMMTYEAQHALSMLLQNDLVTPRQIGSSVRELHRLLGDRLH